MTGCRVDEVGSLKLEHVNEDGSGFNVEKGKTQNALRFVPLVEDAQQLMLHRIAAARVRQEQTPKPELRLFPEWPLKPSTQKVNSASQWFTRYRRLTLGAETDGRLAMHSFRHTWRTIARRAGVPEDSIHELGGWEGSTNTSMLYDHGLTDELLGAASIHWSWRSALHHGETRLCISLPFVLSFIASIARKRPESNRDKATSVNWQLPERLTIVTNGLRVRPDMGTGEV